jgi:exosortase A-associated hydrolase 2
MPFFFHNGDYRLFGILHRPAAPVARQRGFVFCYPCFEEKLWTHRVFVSLARELAARGYHVLRFDPMGHGDSDGDFEQSTVTTRLSDLACAVGTLRQEIGVDAGISLLGLRLGATLAATHAERDPEIASLVLWDPVTDGAPYMQEVLLSNLATQSAVHQQIRFTREDLVAQMRSGQTVNIEGYALSHALYDEVSRLQITGERRFAGPCLIVQTGRANQKAKRNLEELRVGYRQAELSMCVEEPFWKEIKTFYPRAANLAGITLNWLQAHDG